MLSLWAYVGLDGSGGSGWPGVTFIVKVIRAHSKKINGNYLALSSLQPLLITSLQGNGHVYMRGFSISRVFFNRASHYSVPK